MIFSISKPTALFVFDHKTCSLQAPNNVIYHCVSSSRFWILMSHICAPTSKQGHHDLNRSIENHFIHTHTHPACPPGVGAHDFTWVFNLPAACLHACMHKLPPTCAVVNGSELAPLIRYFCTIQATCNSRGRRTNTLTHIHTHTHTSTPPPLRMTDTSLPSTSPTGASPTLASPPTLVPFRDTTQHTYEHSMHVRVK
jgi:hypothetical protein